MNPAPPAANRNRSNGAPGPPEAPDPGRSRDPARVKAATEPTATGAAPRAGSMSAAEPIGAPRPAQAGNPPPPPGNRLGPLAADPATSRGRLHAEGDRTNRGPRDCF